MLRARCLALATLVLVVAAPLAAQGSPNIPLDDPRLPLIEQLILRGTVRDPAPMHRPLRRADVVRALEVADSEGAGGDSALVVHLLGQYREPGSASRWHVEARAGAQAFTRARRDLLHPAGPGGADPYADVRLEGVFGPVVAVSRPVIEPRLTDDPDWPGRRDTEITGRMIEAYLGLQFGQWGRFWFGQFDQNWGPIRYPAIVLSDFAYPRNYLGLDVGARDVRLLAQAGQLRDGTDTSGAVIKRYHVMHRLGVQLTRRFYASLWETTVFAGQDRSLEASFVNPLSLLLLSNQYGEGDQGNIIIGTDVSWQVARSLTLQAQVALDDLQYQSIDDSTRYPNRWAFTLVGFGPLGRRLSWHALYTQASTLAFRTTDPFETFADAGVGTGRGFPDMDLLQLTVSVPILERWLVSPDMALQRQGAARLGDPFPTTADDVRNTPSFLSKPVETTWRLGLTVSGRQGPLDLQATGGLHYLRNAGNVDGVSRTRFEARIQALLFLGTGGRLQ
jgi:hypothetical protein